MSYWVINQQELRLLRHAAPSGVTVAVLTTFARARRVVPVVQQAHWLEEPLLPGVPYLVLMLAQDSR
jgi:hypothetical protein